MLVAALRRAQLELHLQLFAGQSSLLTSQMPPYFHWSKTRSKMWSGLQTEAIDQHNFQNLSKMHPQSLKNTFPWPPSSAEYVLFNRAVHSTNQLARVYQSFQAPYCFKYKYFSILVVWTATVHLPQYDNPLYHIPSQQNELGKVLSTEIQSELSSCRH
jgi:hypothetical protein